MLPDDFLVKYWVLNLAVEFRVPLWLLFPVIGAESLNVKEIPVIAAEDYVAALQELLREHMIQMSLPRSSYHFVRPVKPTLLPDVARCRRADDRTRSVDRPFAR